MISLRVGILAMLFGVAPPLAQAQRAHAAATAVVLPAAREFKHHENITMYFDEASGYGTVQLGPMIVAPEVQLKALFKFKGATLVAMPAQVSIAVISTSDQFRHVTSKRVAFTTDSTGRPRYYPVLVRIPERLEGKYRETMALSLPARAFVSLATANTVAGEVAGVTFSLSAEQQEALRDFASRMGVEAHRNALAATGGPAAIRITASRQGAYSAADVDRRAAQLGGLIRPQYPVVPLDQRRRRSVNIEFVVDTTGLADTATLRSQDGADSAYVRAVMEVIRDWRFTPAMKAGKRVRQVMVQAMPFDPGPMPASVAVDTAGCGGNPASPVIPTSAWTERDVSISVIPFPDNVQPEYPPILKRQRTVGEVATRFVVDDKGIVVGCTIRMLRSTNPLFEGAVRRALPLWGYESASLFGVRVPQIVEHVFRFR